jgi:hypothetical protein
LYDFFLESARNILSLNTHKIRSVVKAPGMELEYEGHVSCKSENDEDALYESSLSKYEVLSNQKIATIHLYSVG